MKILTLILIIVTTSTLISIINAAGSKEDSTNLILKQFFNSFLEAKQRETLFNKYIKLRKELQVLENNLPKQKAEDEDNNARTYTRRKVVGISDNPF
ncbi:unnamed protein product [Rotaria sp. Silwood2]|nr:unnamed protein product [Rotaria sp. Silwood2]CAF2601328.1 unnamed protein product [Rotaria sp. Silwood2]CAF2827604.1 unnamed protein product [Rotaria sp. Silwood2]CAF2972220.1 unnamed protein product [Rotaria sp. Silwood2]CAF3991605.1 unnamed protein product [Rotaria sp. Silwood2]